MYLEGYLAGSCDAEAPRASRVSCAALPTLLAAGGAAALLLRQAAFAKDLTEASLNMSTGSEPRHELQSCCCGY